MGDGCDGQVRPSLALELAWQASPGCCPPASRGWGGEEGTPSTRDLGRQAGVPGPSRTLLLFEVSGKALGDSGNMGPITGGVGSGVGVQ